jgi:hypothetical protein
MQVMSGPDAGVTLVADSVPGLDVHVSFESRSLVYELLLPLESGPMAAYALGVPSGGAFQLGIEGEEVGRDVLRGLLGGAPSGARDDRAGGRSPGGRAGRDMGPPRGGRGGGRGGRYRPPEPLEVWLEVEVG